jgi:2-methylisocitrate lyase-like PEP mutase family enzyme
MTAALRALHVPGTPLLLPNAWDAGSAKLVADAGFPAVATSSAAVAEALGYADHQAAPAAEMFAAAARVAAAVPVPVTVDAEAGYGLAPAELAGRLVDAGAAGCNLEDTDHAGGGLADPARHAEWLAAVRAAAPDLVINARVDVFMTDGDQRAVLADGIRRARAYLAAGADCVYPIDVRDSGVLTEFVAALRPAAVNALYLPGGPDLAALAELGVARISLGAGLWRFTQSAVRKALSGLAGGVAPY